MKEPVVETIVEPAGPSAGGALQVGSWEVAPDLNQIRCGREVVHLEPKTMTVLLYLASRPGEVASRNELLAAVWPGVIVGDNALTQVIIKLRKALGDTAREPAYIEAISKRGYRLIATVVRPSAAESIEPDQARPTVSTRGATLWIGAALVVVVLIGAAIWLFIQSNEGNEAGSRSPSPTELSPTATLPTVIVNPLEAVGEDAKQSLLARALSADLVTDLSKISGLRVISGSQHQGQARQGAEKSRARYALSGTVQGDGEQLRLHFLLTDVVDGRQLWSHRFDRQATDLFAVQDDLVRNILAVLPVKVSEAETLRLAQRYTRNREAYEYFLRAQAALLVRRRAQNETARQMYWKAINSDPTFARAYAGLAMTHALDYQQGWATDAALIRAIEFAKTAEQMSPEMPEAHWVLGFVHTQRRQHEEALRHLESALRLNASYADAYALKAGIHTYIGRPAEGVPLLRTALRLNPDAGSLYFLLLGRAYYFLGDSEQARVNLDHALLRNAENLEARIYLAAVHSLAGETAAAEWQASEIRALEPRFDVRNWLASYPMTDAAQKERLTKSLQALG
ncbi:MAG: winged helix-turn-helix domain-containing tetratricopeptide repeat protein, partial [Burkholderiaceae bacterium]